MAVQREDAVVVQADRWADRDGFRRAFWNALDGFFVGDGVAGRGPYLSRAVSRWRYLFPVQRHGHRLAVRPRQTQRGRRGDGHLAAVDAEGVGRSVCPRQASSAWTPARTRFLAICRRTAFPGAAPATATVPPATSSAAAATPIQRFLTFLTPLFWDTCRPSVVPGVKGWGPDRKPPAKPEERGVADGIRTRDHRDHNPGLYQLSYGHLATASLPGRERPLDGRLGVVLDVAADVPGALLGVQPLDEMERHVDSGRNAGRGDHVAVVDEARRRRRPGSSGRARRAARASPSTSSPGGLSSRPLSA